MSNKTFNIQRDPEKQGILDILANFIKTFDFDFSTVQRFIYILRIF